MKTSEIFKREIEFIKSKHLQKIVINALDVSPECIQYIPASSTGKYHPEYSLGYGGLVRHIKATVGFAYALIEAGVLEGMLKAEESRNAYDDYIEDAVYVSLILHDCMKAKDDDETHRTQFDHPLLAARLFKETTNKYIKENKENICDEDLNRLGEIIPLIMRCIMSHMGKYNRSKYEEDIVLLKPTTILEWFVHQCDLLSSRRYLEFNFEKFNEEQKW